MSQFNAIGEYGLADVLTKRLTTPGGSNAPSVAPELFPTISLEMDRPEWGYLKGEIPFSRGIGTTAPVASQYVILRNPAGSKVLAVVNRLTALASSGVISLYLAPIGNLATGASQGFAPPRDGRLSLISGGIHVRGSASSFFNADAAAPGFSESWRSTGTTLDIDTPWIVSPGTDLGVVARTATATLMVTFEFTERGAQPGELA